MTELINLVMNFFTEWIMTIIKKKKGKKTNHISILLYWIHRQNTLWYRCSRSESARISTKIMSTILFVIDNCLTHLYFVSILYVIKNLSNFDFQIVTHIFTTLILKVNNKNKIFENTLVYKNSYLNRFPIVLEL